jgi:hypothetical protein
VSAPPSPTGHAPGLRAPGLVAVTGLILVGAPLAGIALAGHALEPYLALPPRPLESAPPGFSWGAFGALAALVLAAVTPLVLRFLRARPLPPAAATPRALPPWGWAALLWLAASWTLAWTRFPWFEPFQQHTFTPLWLGYIGVVNAFTMRRAGSCLLTRAPARFAALFPLSALFWWFFEYLNRFVGNWRYAGIEDFGALEYALHATAAFSIVLPAVASTAEWLGTFPRLHAAFESWIPARLPRPKPVAALVLVATTVSLAGLGVFREQLFPLVWISPVLVIICLQALSGRATVLAPLAGGDWRAFVSHAGAALLCGFFWELWNSGSLAHWEYSIPHVDRFRLFGMPLLGYAGYLPFGIECAAIAAMVPGLAAPPAPDHPSSFRFSNPRRS